MCQHLSMLTIYFIKMDQFQIRFTFDDFIKSRKLRGLAESSVGSVCIWRTFQYCLEYFRYFITSSVSISFDGSFFDRIVIVFQHGLNIFFFSSFFRNQWLRIFGTHKSNPSNSRLTWTNATNENNLTYRVLEKNLNR